MNKKYNNLSKEKIEKFWSKVDKTDQCWNWNSSKNSNGYGIFFFRINGKDYREYAHRFSYYLNYNKWPKLCLLHKCDNKTCVNPSHLKEGTRQENQRDMVNKNRSCKGEKNWRHLLTDTDIINILQRLSNGEKQKLIAKDYKISPSSISRINSGEHWKHIQRN